MGVAGSLCETLNMSWKSGQLLTCPGNQDNFWHVLEIRTTFDMSWKSRHTLTCPGNRDNFWHVLKIGTTFDMSWKSRQLLTCPEKQDNFWHVLKIRTKDVQVCACLCKSMQDLICPENEDMTFWMMMMKMMINEVNTMTTRSTYLSWSKNINFSNFCCRLIIFGIWM